MKRVRLLALFSVIPLGALTTAGCFEVRKGHDDNVYICACDADCPYGYSCDGWSATCVTNVETSGSGGRATGGSWGRAGAGGGVASGGVGGHGATGGTTGAVTGAGGHPATGGTGGHVATGGVSGTGGSGEGEGSGGTGGSATAPAEPARSAAPAEPAPSAAPVEPAPSAALVERPAVPARSPATAGPALVAFPGHASRCRRTPALCRFSSECGAGGRCLNGACQPGCTSSTDCGTGDVCTGGYCQPSTTGGASCVFNFDCPANHTCVNGFCHGACATDTDCPAHDMCSAGLCQPDVRPHPSCRSNADCASGTDLCRRLLPQRLPHRRRLLHLHDGDRLRAGRLLRDARRGVAAVPAADRLQRRALLLGRGLLLVATRSDSGRVVPARAPAVRRAGGSGSGMLTSTPLQVAGARDDAGDVRILLRLAGGALGLLAVAQVSAFGLLALLFLARVLFLTLFERVRSSPHVRPILRQPEKKTRGRRERNAIQGTFAFLPNGRGSPA